MKHACHRASQLASDSYERKLSLLETVQLRLHIAMCGLCKNYHHNLKLLHDVFANMRDDEHLPQAKLPEESKARILHALNKEGEA